MITFPFLSGLPVCVWELIRLAWDIFGGVVVTILMNFFFWQTVLLLLRERVSGQRYRQVIESYWMISVRNRVMGSRG